jgi:hypothetical protein
MSSLHYDCNSITIDYDSVVNNPKLFFEILSNHGVVAVSGVMSADKRATARQLSEGFLEEITKNFPVPYKSDDPDSWKTIRKLSFLHSNLVQNYQVGSSRAAWFIRSDPRLMKIWAILLKCNVSDLFCSLGTLGIQKPPEITNPKSDAGFRKRTKFHCDQLFSDTKDAFQVNYLFIIFLLSYFHFAILFSL